MNYKYILNFVTIWYDNIEAWVSNACSFEGLENRYFISEFVQRNHALMKISFHLEVY